MVDGRLDELEDRVTETSNAVNMTHDYCSGIHYAVVESGGFLRNGFGLSHDEWIHLNILERANMVAHHTMGTPNYMHLVRHRVGPMGNAVNRCCKSK